MKLFPSYSAGSEQQKCPPRLEHRRRFLIPKTDRDCGRTEVLESGVVLEVGCGSGGLVLYKKRPETTCKGDVR